MAINIEWKARAREPERQQILAVRLADGPPELLEQTDTFFEVPRGRLKLRHFGPDRGELIYYVRADLAGAKVSSYSLVPTAQPQALRDMLARALGVRGEVRKRRLLYRAGRSRIHFDEVDGLGAFLEVEVVLRPDQAAADGEPIAVALRKALEVQDEDLIAGAYIDLLEES